MPKVRRKSAVGALAPADQIARQILMLRGQKVLLDAHLAELYGVETKALTRAVRRKLDRFPDDFMFQATIQEVTDLRYQFGTSNSRGGRRYPPYAFTEQGVAMLSSVLRSKCAVAVNIEIMRAFVKLREMRAGHGELAEKLAKLEQKSRRVDRAPARSTDSGHFDAPISKPKKQRRKGRQQNLVFDEGKSLSTQEQQYAHTAILNGVREHVDKWRKLPSPNDRHVTSETACVLQPNDPDSYFLSRELVPNDTFGHIERARIEPVSRRMIDARLARQPA
jgi:hypothetical protein